MTNRRDDASRAEAYLASDKPLFQSRHLPRKYLRRSNTPREVPISSPADSPGSRIPTRKPFTTRGPISLTDAWERAAQEEGQQLLVPNGSSPSPAPRPRPMITESQYETVNAWRREAMISTRGTNRLDATYEVQGNAHTPFSNESGSVSSVADATVGIDNPEDDIDRRIRQHRRDRERLNAAIGSKTALFTRGSVGHRVSETANTLTKKTSGSSADNEPGVRIPRTWGSKARPQKNWLARIMSPESLGEDRGVEISAPSDEPVDWAAAAADIPLPSVEEDFSGQEPTPPHSRPSSAHINHNSPQKSRIWDAEQDFTAQSLLVSTSPIINPRNVKVDAVRAREIETLSRRAVATSRLEEIKERNSMFRSVSPEPVRAIPQAVLDEIRSWQPRDLSPSKPISTRMEPDTRIHLPKENDVPLIRTRSEGDRATRKTHTLPIVSFRRANTEELPEMVPLPPLLPLVDTLHPLQPGNRYERTLLEEEAQPILDTLETISRGVGRQAPDYKKYDPWEDLRKLSRVLSASPRTSPETATQSEKSRDEPAKVSNVLSVDTKRLSGASTPPKSDADPEERIVAEASLFELPDIKSDRNSLRTPSAERTQAVDETPQPKPDPLSLTTPVVTGAYIETPATRGPEPTVRLTSARIIEMLNPKPRTKARRALANTAQTYTVREDLQSLGASTPSDTPSDGERSSTSTVPQVIKSESESISSGNTQDPACQTELRTVPQIVESQVGIITPVDARGCDCEKKQKTVTEVIEPEPQITAPVKTRNPPRKKQWKTVPRAVESEVDSIISAHRRQRARQLEAQSIEHLENVLQTSLQNIRDAKKGIEHLEDQVSTARPASLSPPEPTSPAVMYLMIPIPRLWHSSTPFMYPDSSKSSSASSKARTGFRLTTLGLILAIFMLWLIAETAICEAICHPKYGTAETRWHPSDPFWGYALPTFADRASGGILGVLWAFLCRIFGPVLRPPMKMLLDVLWYL